MFIAVLFTISMAQKHGKWPLTGLRRNYILIHNGEGHWEEKKGILGVLEFPRIKGARDVNKTLDLEFAYFSKL